MVRYCTALLDKLQQSNEKALYLALLRVLMCGWFLIELLFRWPSFEMIYSDQSVFNVPVAQGLHLLHLDALWLRQHCGWIVFTTGTLILLNLLGIGRNLVALLMFLSLTLLHCINEAILNGGDKMAMLLAFYMLFADSYSRFTLLRQPVLSATQQRISNLFSNLASYSILLNLCLVYFMAGLYKLTDPKWQNGTAIYYFLKDKRYSLLNSYHFSLPLVLQYLINYGTLAFELLFPFLVWRKRTRNPMLLLGCILHTGIYIFLMIYGMSVVFIIQYGLFYTNEEITAILGKLSKRVKNLLPWSA